MKKLILNFNSKDSRKIKNPKLLENHLNMIPGVVENGLFINLCTKMILADGEQLIIKDRKVR